LNKSLRTFLEEEDVEEDYLDKTLKRDQLFPLDYWIAHLQASLGCCVCLIKAEIPKTQGEKKETKREKDQRMEEMKKKNLHNFKSMVRNLCPTAIPDEVLQDVEIMQSSTQSSDGRDWEYIGSQYSQNSVDEFSQDSQEPFGVRFSLGEESPLERKPKRSLNRSSSGSVSYLAYQLIV